MEKTFILRSEEDTIGFGAAVGLLLPRGAFVAMYGGLGAGKTTMVRGIASSLGADHRDIMSPTFTIVREHTISVPFSILTHTGLAVLMNYTLLVLTSI